MSDQRTRGRTGWMIVAAVVFGSASLNAEESRSAPDYEREVKPLLQARCYACHGALKQQSGLRLDTVAFMLRGGDSGPAITTKTVDESLLLARVSSTDLSQRMPPEHEGEPFTQDQIKLLRRWIEAGAVGPANEQPEADPREHWSFQPIVRPPVPNVRQPQWVRNPIDAFIAQRHEQLGLKPLPEAPRTLLLRRLSIDLVGLPPSPQEVMADDRDLGDDWYERAVERLLDDPRHGERWARHWMDIWRYSDWWGLGQQLRNSQQHIWHWRDWMIESLNADVPYDEMVRLMLAGDELAPNDLNKLRATGYLARNYFLFNRNQWMDETVEHVSKAFLGLTTNCAKCHDHKYDPISQADYYRLRAFFEPYHVRNDMLPGESELDRDAIPRAFDGWLDRPTYLFVRGQESQPDKSASLSPGIPEILQFAPLAIEPVKLPVEAFEPERRPWVIEGYRSAAQKRVEAAESALATARQKLLAMETIGWSGWLLGMRDSNNIAAALLTGFCPDPASSSLPRIGDPSSLPSDEEGQDKNVRRSLSRQARLEWELAHLRFDAAQAELRSIDSRAAATRQAWKRSDADRPPSAAGAAEAAGAQQAEEEQAGRQLAQGAVRSERELAAARARVTVAEISLRLLQVPDDKREAVLKELTAAREKLAAAVKQMDEPGEQFSKFVGAAWFPTRFLNSGTDDPAVEFQPFSSGRRQALATWITDRRNPLTARVAVNHVWMRHFGTPLVPTVFDFGRNGAAPSHPELLDWLAAEFIESGWSMKHLHRLMVDSATYRLASWDATADANLVRDSDNLAYWRRTPSRLESQVVRDSILSLAGKLDMTRGGPPVLAAQQADSKRRSLYFFHSNNERNLFLTTFDEALVKDCYRREQSIVPQQALALSNSRLVLDAVRPIVERLERELSERSGVSEEESPFIRLAFLALLGVSPSEQEMAASRSALAAWQQLPEAPSGPEGHRFAREQLIWVLLNHNDFVTLR